MTGLNYLNYQNIELICSKNNNKLFICLPQNPTGFNNTSNEEKMFNYNLLPSFIKDIIPENSFSNSLPNFNFSNETNAKTGYKFDLIISNKYQDFHKLQASKNDEDEVEASYDVTVAKFKEWILDKYISNEKFKAKIQAELLKLDPEIASKFIFNFQLFQMLWTKFPITQDISFVISLKLMYTYS